MSLPRTARRCTAAIAMLAVALGSLLPLVARSAPANTLQIELCSAHGAVATSIDLRTGQPARPRARWRR